MFKLQLCIFLTLFGFVMANVIGWVMNIVHLVGLEAFAFSGENIIRIVGIFIAPIGAIMGWFF